MCVPKIACRVERSVCEIKKTCFISVWHCQRYEYYISAYDGVPCSSKALTGSYLTFRKKQRRKQDRRNKRGKRKKKRSRVSVSLGLRKSFNLLRLKGEVVHCKRNRVRFCFETSFFFTNIFFFFFFS